MVRLLLLLVFLAAFAGDPQAALPEFDVDLLRLYVDGVIAKILAVSRGVRAETAIGLSRRSTWRRATTSMRLPRICLCFMETELMQ